MTVASDRKWVALIRGINLGRNKRLAMSDLKALLEALGYNDVRTYLATGNALFTTAKPRTTAAKLEHEIATQLRDELGLDVKVLVRTAEELEAVVEGNPFLAAGVDPKQLQAAFLATSPPADKTSALEPDQFAPDGFQLGDRVVYLHMPNGFMGSKLPDWEKVLGVDVSIRTWSVVTKLRDLARDG